jgi:hypothetical protein
VHFHTASCLALAAGSPAAAPACRHSSRSHAAASAAVTHCACNTATAGCLALAAGSPAAAAACRPAADHMRPHQQRLHVVHVTLLIAWHSAASVVGAPRHSTNTCVETIPGSLGMPCHVVGGH